MVICLHPKFMGADLKLSQMDPKRVHPMFVHIKGVDNNAILQL